MPDRGPYPGHLVSEACKKMDRDCHIDHAVPVVLLAIPWDGGGEKFRLYRPRKLLGKDLVAMLEDALKWARRLPDA